ncbi:MAG TPA: Gfo/Idh/MocA family oxidoreductase [Anaerolineales bacterium]|nr:Gfo/Idh/MocA family oxidoreductase [Anaerolineales bacterium]
MSAAQNTYTVAVAGLGKRGMHHAEAISKNPRFKLVGLCDIDAARLEAAKATFGVDAINADAVQLLKDTRPDVFVFCTLPQIRLPLIRAGVENGARLIAYEKPIAMSMNEALEIDKLLRDGKVKSVVSHQHRYGDHYRKVKEIISSGAIGRVHTVYGTAIGWMMHMMTHMIDYASWYNDYADPLWVVAQADGKEKFSDVHASPDYIGALVQFSNGVRGIIECGALAPDVPEVDSMWHKCRIGAQGTEGFAEVLTGKEGKGGGWRAVTRDGVSSGPGAMDYAHDMPPYIQDIANWLDDPAKVHPCNGETAFKGFQVMMAACRSVVQRGKVTLPLGPGEPELEALKKVL